MKKFLSVLLLLLLTAEAFSQTITIKDKETLQPIEFVTLISDAHAAQTTTNSHGQADVSTFINAEKIEVHAFGYLKTTISYSNLKSANFELLLSPFNLNLDEVVVSGTRWRQTTGNVPSKIISVSQREVALQNPQTTADLLGLSGKVYIQKSQQGGGSPMIRGFATNRLLYTVDGVRMNTAIFRSGNIQNV